MFDVVALLVTGPLSGSALMYVFFLCPPYDVSGFLQTLYIFSRHAFLIEKSCDSSVMAKMCIRL